MARVEFSGRDLEEAIASAAAALNLPPEKVKFNLLTMGSKGFLGLGRKPARISVDPDDPALSLDDEGEGKSPAPKRPPAGEGLPPKTTAPAAPKEEKPKAAPASRDKRPEAPKPAPPRPEAKPLDWSHVPPPPTRPGPGESESPADDPEAQLAQELVREIVSRMGLEARLSARRLGSRLVVALDSPDNAILIGSRGATLEALQLLAAKILLRRTRTAESPADESRLVLDVADYRARRQTQLLDNLKALAGEVRSSGRPQTLGGLGPAERRLALMALKPFKDLNIAAARGREGLVITPAAGQRPPHSPRSRRPRRGDGPGQKSPPDANRRPPRRRPPLRL